MDTTADGVAHGVLRHFRLQLTDEVRLSTDPRVAADANSWRHAQYLGDQQEVRTGDRVTIRYGYRRAGAPDGATLAVVRSAP